MQAASHCSSRRSSRAPSSSPTSRARCRSRTASTSSSWPPTRAGRRRDPAAQGPRHVDRRPARARRRGRRRHRADAELPRPDARAPGACEPLGGDAARPALPAARRRRAARLRRVHGSRTSSSPATGSGWTSAGEPCPTCTSSRARSCPYTSPVTRTAATARTPQPPPRTQTAARKGRPLVKRKNDNLGASRFPLSRCKRICGRNGYGRYR